MSEQTLKWTDVPAHIVLAAADICDGHTIFAPEAFLEVGVPAEMVARYTVKHESDLSNHKETIYDCNSGAPMDETHGVYGLALLIDMVRDFDLGNTYSMGRGFLARECQKKLHDSLGASCEK